MAQERLDIFIEVYGTPGNYGAVVRSRDNLKYFPQCLDGYGIQNEAFAEAITWISEMVPFYYPDYEYNLIPFFPN